MLQNSLFIITAVLGIIILIVLLRSGHFLRCLLFSAITGNAALFSVGYLGAFTGVVLSINLFTVAVASILGIPGVLTMLILKLLFAG
ncbi:pro-sigmaK processing inhibitor BofA family protein [Oscillospiraceae bacterium PP1C4]